MKGYFGKDGGDQEEEGREDGEHNGRGECEDTHV